MSNAELLEFLSEKFKGARIRISDISGNQKYYRVTIKSCVFNGKNELDRQRYFYSLVWEDIKEYLCGVNLTLIGDEVDDVF